MKTALLFSSFFFLLFVSACTRATPTSLPTRLPLAQLPTTAATTPPVLPTETAVSTPSPLRFATSTASMPTPTTTAAPSVNGRFPQHTLLVELDYSAHQATISQTISLLNNSLSPWAEAIFHASLAHWPGLFVLDTANVHLNGTRYPVQPTWDNTMLHVPLPHSLPPGQTAEIQFTYRLLLPHIALDDWGPAGNAGWNDDLLQMGDWYLTVVPYQDGAGWRTWQFAPVGDPVISDLADYEVTISTAPTLTIAAAGFVTKTADSWHYSLPQARAFSFQASPHFLLLEDTFDGIPIEVYVLDTHYTAGTAVLQTARNALALFSEWYGPYPYAQLVIAENGFVTSHEYSAFISLGGSGFEVYNGRSDSLLVAITAHEVAHQWWYGGVGNDQVHEPWLDESMAMFGELLYYERYHPDLVPWWWAFRVDRWQAVGFVNVDIYEYNSTATYVHNMYGQASYFIRDLRLTMGESAFRAFLGDYYVQNQQQFTSTERFFAIAQSHTPVDLSPLRQQYFQTD